MKLTERCYKVYKHTSPNGKVYVGVTSSTINDRWRDGKGYKDQVFYRAILKYGWDNIKHEVLCEGLSKEEAHKKEIEIIAFYKSNDKLFGYNCTIGGEGTHGFKYTEEQRKAIGERQRGKKLSEKQKRKIGESNKGKHTISQETRIKMISTRKKNGWTVWNTGKCVPTKTVVQYDLNGNKIKEFVSAHSAYLETGARHVIECCKGKRKSDKGFVWKFA